MVGRHHHLLGVGETFLVGKLRAVVHHINAVAQQVGEVGGGLAYVAAADHYQRGRGGETLDENFGAFGGDGFGVAEVGDAPRGCQRRLVQRRRAQGAGYRAVGP